MGANSNKSIAIIGEGELEWFYFDSLGIASLPVQGCARLSQHSDINHILKLVESPIWTSNMIISCALLDMDRLYQFPSEMQQYQKQRKSTTKRSMPEGCYL